MIGNFVQASISESCWDITKYEKKNSFANFVFLVNI